MKLTTDRHEASRGLFATAELLVLLVTSSSDLLQHTIKFCSVVFGVTSRLSVINNLKQDSLMRRAAAFVDRGRRTIAASHTPPSKC